MKIRKFNTATLISIIAVVFTLFGCEKEGPAEQAGENIDEAVQEMQEKAQDTGQKAMDKMESAADSATQ
jgi:ABC-type enterochelin transport system substrate-binding protein